MSLKQYGSALFVAISLQLTAPAYAAQADAQPAPSTTSAASTRIALSGVRVTGVGDHPADAIDPQRIQALADAALRDAAGPTGLPASLDFTQLEAVAERITAAYRQAGFLATQAILPPQTIGDDGILHIQVIEGQVGAIRVEGSRRYRDDQLNARALHLIGQPLRLRELERAVLYARDLPGVAIDSVLEPGQLPGQTDIVLQARDNERPYEIHAALSNHGSDSTGRYRAELGINGFNLMGAGDTLTANIGYGLDPADSWQAALALTIPSRAIDGLALAIGVSRTEMEINTGPLAALDIHGPTTLAYVGTDWKFVNRRDLLAQASLRWIHQQSILDALGSEMSRHTFDVVDAGLSLRHLDRRWRGVNHARIGVRKSVNDDSPAFNWLFPPHDSHFLIGRVALSRLQTLPTRQRLLLRTEAQFTSSALVPMEQFALGGPSSVRAYALSSALGDRGVLASLDYQIDAPGFADRPSPFGGRPWGDLLTLGAFYDWGRVSPVAQNRALGILPETLQGAGVSLGLRLPTHPQWQLDLSAAKPTGRTRPADGDDLQVWARVGTTF